MDNTLIHISFAVIHSIQGQEKLTLNVPVVEEP